MALSIVKFKNSVKQINVDHYHHYKLQKQINIIKIHKKKIS